MLNTVLEPQVYSYLFRVGALLNLLEARLHYPYRYIDIHNNMWSWNLTCDYIIYTITHRFEINNSQALAKYVGINRYSIRVVRCKDWLNIHQTEEWRCLDRDSNGVARARLSGCQNEFILFEKPCPGHRDHHV